MTDLAPRPSASGDGSYGGSGPQFAAIVDPGMVDHRGAPDLGGLCVLLDRYYGDVANNSLNLGEGYNCRGFTASIAANYNVGEPMSCQAEMYPHGAGGVLVGRVVNLDGHLTCAFQGRLRRVDDQVTMDKVPDAPALSVFQEERYREFVSDELLNADHFSGGTGGLEVTRAVMQRRLDAGPLANLIGVQLFSASLGAASAVVNVQPWMANLFGDVQFGVMVAMHTTVSKFAAQTLVRPDRDFVLTDISCDYINRPQLGDCSQLTIDTEVVRVEDSVLVVNSEMIDEFGNPVSAATLSVTLDQL